MDVMDQRKLPQEVVASYASYGEAQQAVDHLSDERFPVEGVIIVGRDLSLVERVTGRLDYGQAALQGAASGAFLGFFLGLVFGLLSIVDPLVSSLALAFYGVIIGALAGAVVGLISHAMSRGQRDFSSMTKVEADHFDVLASPDAASRARQLLGTA